MRSRRRQRNKPVDDTKASADKVLSAMLAQARAQFGDAVKYIDKLHYTLT